MERLFDLDKARTCILLDETRESALAAQYIKQFGLKPEIQAGNEKNIREAIERWGQSALFANSFNEPNVPAFVISDPKYCGAFIYLSFSGVKAFIRREISNANTWGADDKAYWEKIRTYYREQDYDKEKGCHKEVKRLVTCFDKDREIIFEGPIDAAPINLRPHLEAHDYNSWHEVSGWTIGSLEELIKKTDKNGFIIDEATKTVLFPDEIDRLSQGKRIVAEDSRSAYHVSYEAYFTEGSLVCGLCASMVD